MINKIKILTKKLSWSFTGNVIFALSQWGIITIIARFGSPDDLGIYSISLAITAPIILFFNFQLRLVLVTDATESYTFSDYFSSRIIHMLFAYIVIIVVAILYSDNFSLVLVILFMGLAKLFESLSDICLGYFQKIGNIEHIGKSQMFRGIQSIFIVGIVYILSENISFSVFILSIVMFIRFIRYDLRKLRNHIQVNFYFTSIYKELIKKTYPLGITSLVVSLNTNIPRYIIDKSLGIKEVGVFSVLYYVLIAVNMFIAPVMLLIAPKIATYYKKNNKMSFIKYNLKLTILINIIYCLIFIPCYVYSEEILQILYGYGYNNYNNELIILLISLLFGILIELYNISIVTSRFLKSHFMINLLVTIATLFIGIMLIDDYGLLGAAYTILFSRIIHFILTFGLFIYSVSKKR